MQAYLLLFWTRVVDEMRYSSEVIPWYCRPPVRIDI